MNKNTYIERVEEILKGGLHDIGCYEYSSGNYTQEELEIYNDGLFDQLYQLHLEGVREGENRIKDEIEGLQFMYEHRWYDKDEIKACGKCGEVVKKGDPCKDSPHYNCWLGLEIIMKFLEQRQSLEGKA